MGCGLWHDESNACLLQYHWHQSAGIAIWQSLKEPLNISTWVVSVQASSHIAVKSHCSHAETSYMKSLLSQTRSMHRKPQQWADLMMKMFIPGACRTVSSLSRCRLHRAGSLAAFIWAQTLSLLTLATKQRFHCPASLKKWLFYQDIDQCAIKIQPSIMSKTRGSEI